MTDTTEGAKVAQRGSQARLSTLPQDLTNPDSAVVVEALSRRCDQCRAPIGQLCVQRGGYRADLTGRLVHLGRLLKP
jgi:hypothetical protein